MGVRNLRRGRRLVEHYLELLDACRNEKVMAYHLDEMLRVAEGGQKRGTEREGCR